MSESGSGSGSEFEFDFSEFEEEFKSDPEAVDIPLDSAAYIEYDEQIQHHRTIQEATKAEAHGINSKINDVEAEMAAVDAQIAELAEKKKQIRARKLKLEDEKWELHRRNKAAERAEQEAADKIEAIKRQQMLAAEARRVAEQQKLVYKSIYDATKDDEWREFVYTHQEEGSTYLTAARRAICGDEMGLGKTLQSLVTQRKLHAMGDLKSWTLILAPGEITNNFENEASKWFPDRGVVNLANLGTKTTLEQIEYWIELFEGETDKLTILLNYEIIARSTEVVKLLSQYRPSMVICDEAHRLKNMDRNTYKAVEILVLGHNQCSICEGPVWEREKKFAKYSDIVLSDQVYCIGEHGEVTGTRSVENVLLMTGTPIRNNPRDFFPLLHLVHPKIFANIYKFELDFCSTNYKGDVVWSHSGHSRLVSKIKGMYIARKRTDTDVELPPQTVQVHEIAPSAEFYPKQRAILERLWKQSSIEIEKGKITSLFSILPKITRQRQASVWPGGIYMDVVDPITGIETREHVGKNYLESAKLDHAMNLIKELRENEQRIIVFSSFKEPLVELQRRFDLLPDSDRVTLFVGDTPKDQRKLIKNNLDRTMGEVAKWDVVLAHYTLGSEGVNFSAATQMIILDEYWNDAFMQQAYGRMNRSGQTEDNTVHILRLVMPGSFDKAMAAMIEHKKGITMDFETAFKFEEIADLFKNG